MMNIHFQILKEVFKCYGFNAVILDEPKDYVIKQGLKHSHNDGCYPAILCAGQFLAALDSGKYDKDKVALLMIQTGGGCRASNYISTIRKAVENSGYSDVPVISINASGLEKDTRIKLSPLILKRAHDAMCYADTLMLLSNQTKAYELNKGETDRMLESWINKIGSDIKSKFFFTTGFMKKRISEMAKSFASIKISNIPKMKVGIVGEVFVKYSSLANNNLEEFLNSEECEVRIPGFYGFLEYAVDNKIYEVNHYGGSQIIKTGASALLKYMGNIEKMIINEIKSHTDFATHTPYKKLRETADKIIDRGCKMGEGWMLTAEMANLIEEDCPNIVCAQPFGCLPNHIVGKGMVKAIKKIHNTANIVTVDYDPGSTPVNQENRIKLMLSNASPVVKADAVVDLVDQAIDSKAIKNPLDRKLIDLENVRDAVSGELALS